MVPRFSRLVARVQSTRTNTTQAWETAKPYETIPGPKPWPVIGNIWRNAPGIGYLSDEKLGKCNETFYQKYGKISRFSGVLGRNETVLLFDPVDVDTVLCCEGAWPARVCKPTMTGFCKHLPPNYRVGSEESRSGFTAVEHTLRHPGITRNSTQSLIDLVNRAAEEFLDSTCLIRNTTDELPADFLTELVKHVVETMVIVALDKRLRRLQETLASNSELNNTPIMFESLINIQQVAMKTPRSTPSWRVLSRPGFLIKNKSFASHSQKKANWKHPDGERQLSTLEHILSQDPSHKAAYAMIMNMLTAGTETISTAMALLLQHLADKPDRQKRLQNEIIEGSTPGITVHVLREMKYLTACIQESIRMLPVERRNARTTRKDMVIRGYKIPQGTDVIMSHNTLSLVQVHYPKPNTFIPERWLQYEFNKEPFLIIVQVLIIKILRKYSIAKYDGQLQT